MLKISNLTVKYGELTALRNLSMSVATGKLTAVVGANCSGKSTLLKTIMGWLKPTLGIIELEGKRIDHLSPHERAERGLAYVPEGRRLFTYFTVLENLELGAHRLDARKAKLKTLREVFEKFPILEDRKNQLAGTLSGGEQQILAIARAMMSKPILLMLDEPSTGLAPTLASQVFDIAKSISNDGVTCLLVEQNPVRALRIAEHAIILQNGIVAIEGIGRELLENADVGRTYLGA